MVVSCAADEVTTCVEDDNVVTGDDVIDVENVTDGVGESEADVVDVTTGIDVGT